MLLKVNIRDIEDSVLNPLNEILLLSQPAHLQKYFGQEMDHSRRDFVRAQMVREKLRDTTI